MKKIAVLTSGGDSPGMNAAIRAVVRSCVFNDVEVCGFCRGYSGLIEGDFKDLKVRSVANILGRGGTILKSDRSEEFHTKEGRKKAYDNLISEGIDGLVVIGGNGTFTGALTFYAEYGFPIIGLPGTIDNDLEGTDNTIGFDTATNTAVEAVDKIRDTADSHSRLFFIEVMGRDSGFIALSTGIATGAIAVMTHETGTTVNDLVNILESAHERKKSSSIVIVAEGENNGGAYEIANKVKAISDKYDIRITVLGHLQRGGSPTCADRVLASRLGVQAIESLLKGDMNCMIGVVNDKLVHTSFETAINKKKNTLKNEVRLAQILSI